MNGPSGHAVLRLLAIPLVISTFACLLFAQSSPPKDGGTLEVASAKYFKQADKIEFRLVNHGASAVTAYMVAFEVTNAERKVKSLAGFGEDMLSVILRNECRLALPNTSYLPTAFWTLWPNPSNPGISPGSNYVRAIPSSVDKSEMNPGLTEVHARVIGVIWADGTVEAKEMAVYAMKHNRDERERTSSDEESFLTVLNAHPEDTDIQHRIAQAQKDLTDLKDREGASFGEVRNVNDRLKTVAVSQHPSDAFQAYVDLLSCQHQRRLKMPKLVMAEK